MTYIDKDSAIRTAIDMCVKVVGHGITQIDAVDIADAFENIPTADVVEVKHGEWKINCDGYYPYCDNCKTEPKNGVLSNYCPECGAKMDGERRGT